MEVRILGPLEVVADGRPVPRAGAKPRALPATLALAAGEAVSADRLIATAAEALPLSAVGATLDSGS